MMSAVSSPLGNPGLSAIGRKAAAIKRPEVYRVREAFGSSRPICGGL